LTKERALGIFMECFPNTYFIDKKGQVFKTKISTLNADLVLREMGLR